MRTVINKVLKDWDFGLAATAEFVTDASISILEDRLVKAMEEYVNTIRTGGDERRASDLDQEAISTSK